MIILLIIFLWVLFYTFSYAIYLLKEGNKKGFSVILALMMLTAALFALNAF